MIDIDYIRMLVINELGRGSEEFPDIKKEVFYFDEEGGCWTTRQAEQPSILPNKGKSKERR